MLQLFFRVLEISNWVCSCEALWRCFILGRIWLVWRALTVYDNTCASPVYMHVLWRVTNTRCAFLLWRQNNNETNSKLLYIMFDLCSYTCWSLGKTQKNLFLFLISYPKQLVCLTGPLQMGTITFTSHWIRFQQLCHPFSHLLMLAKGPTQGHSQYGQVGSCPRCEN